jgi:hypothetical protein
VSKNLFDPERGAGAMRDAEVDSRAVQRVRNLVLVGTIIIGNDKVAILQDETAARAGAGGPGPGQNTPTMRLKVGDSVDGFRLSEIVDRKVVFTKDASRVEVTLDYFRKIDLAPTKPGAPAKAGVPGAVTPPVKAAVPGGVAPPVVPNLPRRPRIPLAPSQVPDS